MRVWVVCLALAFGCAEPAASTRAPVVYGEDGRLEVYEHPNAALVAVARSAIAMKIHEDNVDVRGPDDVRIDYTRTLREAKDLCDGERFADQIEPGTCSGTLIDEQHVLTAGHCMDEPDDCAESVWLFGFSLTAPGTYSSHTERDVYRCGSVVGSFDDGEVDWAIVRLARPVVGHAPATVRTDAAALPDGTPLALIGHPNGLPMKIDDGGEVTWSAGDALSLRATVDAFSGNSGSGTFTHDGTLVAILGGGETDYVANGACDVVNVIDPPPIDDGERLTYLRPALEAFCEVPGVTSSLCDCGGAPCIDGPAGDRCAEAEVLDPVSQTVTDTLTGYAPWSRGSCAGDGPDRVYALTLTESMNLVATTEGFDTVLYLRRDACDGAELDCNDDVSDEDRGSRVAAGLLAGTYYLFVDAYDGDVGDFTLSLELEPRALPDAGPPPMSDAGAPDAGVAPPDAGAPGGGEGMGGCRAVPTGGAAWPWLLLGLLAYRRR